MIGFGPPPVPVPPRLATRTLAATFATVALVLLALFVALIVDARERVRDSVAERLAAGQRIFSTLDARRQEELQALVAILAESPTLKAALDTYTIEGPDERTGAARQLRATVQREVDKLALRFPADVIAITDATRRTVAVAGRRRRAWPVGHRVNPETAADAGGQNSLMLLSGNVFRAMRVPLLLGDAPIGELCIATALDDRYAEELSRLSGADTVILYESRVVGTTFDAARSQAAMRGAASGFPADGVIDLNHETHALRRLSQAGAAEFYAFSSIEPAAADAVRAALARLGWIAGGALLLAALASLGLARTLSRPIDQLTQSILAIRGTSTLEGRVTLTGSSRELDALASTFNDLMTSVAAAQEDTRAASVGAIRALAAALDARDPYTAGHSERVSALSTAIGRELNVAADELDVLRLGALLHDIGKIGLSDAVLRKPARLTREEFDVIRRHPTVGARILGPVAFLAPHVAIVELHHERPDGRGYPHGLQGDQIPLLARIVHVADAFDAITSARAYRPARNTSEAIAELWRGSGSEFDAEVVSALMRTIGNVPAMEVARMEPAGGASIRSTDGSVVTLFPTRGDDAMREALVV
jgi:putative nucleotidyltransferase with HDIG domain